MFVQFNTTVSSEKISQVRSMYGNYYMEKQDDKKVILQLVMDLSEEVVSIDRGKIKSLKTDPGNKRIEVTGFMSRKAYDRINKICENTGTTISEFAAYAVDLAISENGGSEKETDNLSKVEINTLKTDKRKSSDFAHNRAADKYFGR